MRNLLLAWAPFDEVSHCIVVRGESAFAWAWDRAQVARQLIEASAPPNARLHPEALLTVPAVGDTVRLVAALEGVDGQLWRRGELLASRWWPAVPAQDDWSRWVRAVSAEAGRDAVEPLPELQTLEWQPAWAEGVDLDALLSSASRLERVALGAALAGLVGLSSAQLHQAWQAYGERSTLAVERDRLTAVAAPAIGARDRALALASEAGVLSAQLAAPQPLEVMQHLAERLPVRGVTLKELELSGARLRIGLEVPPDLPRTAIVKELQAAGWFVQVNEVRDVSGRGWIAFEMQIQGLRPPVADRAPLPNAALPGPAGLPAATPAAPGLVGARP